MPSLKILFYFVVPYLVGWVLLWVSLPAIWIFRKGLFRLMKRAIEVSPGIGDGDGEGNRVFQWYAFMVKYHVTQDRHTGRTTVRYLSVKERISSAEAALQDFNRFFRSLIGLVQKAFLSFKS